MARLKIGVDLTALELPLRRGLEEAQRLGVAGVQLDAAGDLTPRQLSETGRRQLRQWLRAHDLECAALRCPLRRGLDEAENQEARIDHVKEVMSLSFDLGPRPVVVEAGRPAEGDEAAAARFREALDALVRHGDRVGAILALETGPESGEAFRALLDKFDTGSLAVNYDPASLLMHGHSPYEGARTLHGRIAQVVGRDARRAGASRAAQEVPLGHGDIDWLFFMGVLEEIGYHGWVTVSREGGSNRRADVAAGVAFLRRVIV
jgi:sugar phosphate isomerase/epimerase